MKKRKGFYEKANQAIRVNSGLLLFLLAAHFVLVSNVLYLAVLDKSILPKEFQGNVFDSLFKALHAFSYAVFLIFCSKNTTSQNYASRATKGILIGVLTSLLLLLLSFSSQTHAGGNNLLQSLFYFVALILGGFGDALATPALIGIIASTGNEKGPKYMGYFWASVSIANIYVPFLAIGFQSLMSQNSSYRTLPFAFDTFISLLALITFPIAYSQFKRSHTINSMDIKEKKIADPLTFPKIFNSLKSNGFVMACVLILAANQFALNSVRTASQDFPKPWRQLGIMGSSIMFTAASYFIAKYWKYESQNTARTRVWVLISIVVLIVVGTCVFVLQPLPAIGAATMLFFGPFSAMLHTGVNVQYTQYAIEQNSGNLASQLGIFSSFYRFIGSIGYLVAALIAFSQTLTKLPKEFFIFTINGFPIIVSAIIFAILTKNKNREKPHVSRI